jgi:hypothetical protein
MKPESTLPPSSPTTSIFETERLNTSFSHALRALVLLLLFTQRTFPPSSNDSRIAMDHDSTSNGVFLFSLLHQAHLAAIPFLPITDF